MNEVIEEGEQELVELKTQMADMMKHAETENVSDDSDDDHQLLEQDIEALKSEQQQKFDRIVQDHSLHMKVMTETLQSSVQEAKKWAEMRTNSVRSEKSAQLDQPESNSPNCR
jgi:hypothetical protein